MLHMQQQVSFLISFQPLPKPTKFYFSFLLFIPSLHFLLYLFHAILKDCSFQQQKECKANKASQPHTFCGSVNSIQPSHYTGAFSSNAVQQCAYIIRICTTKRRKRQKDKIHEGQTTQQLTMHLDGPHQSIFPAVVHNWEDCVIRLYAFSRDLIFFMFH